MIRRSNPVKTTLVRVGIYLSYGVITNVLETIIVPPGGLPNTTY